MATLLVDVIYTYIMNTFPVQVELSESIPADTALGNLKLLVENVRFLKYWIHIWAFIE